MTERGAHTLDEAPRNAVIAAAQMIMEAMNANVLAIILVDLDGQVSSIPNPHLNPGDVFRAIGGQNWESSARIAEEMSR